MPRVKGWVWGVAATAAIALAACGSGSDDGPGGGGSAGATGGAAGGGASGASGGSGTSGSGGTSGAGGAAGTGGASGSAGAAGAAGVSGSAGAAGAGASAGVSGSAGMAGAAGSVGAAGAGGTLVDVTTPKVNEIVRSMRMFATANAIALDSASAPHIVHAGTSDGMYYATKQGASWTSEPIEEGFEPGGAARLAFGPGDVPHVLYRNATTKKLRYAKKQGGSWTTMDVAPAVEVNTRLDLALDATGAPHAVFQNLSGPQHGYAHWNGTSFDAEAIPGSTGSGPSIVIGAGGVVFTAAGNPDGSVFASGTSGSFTVSTFDPASGSAFDQTDLAIDSQGDLHLVYVVAASRLYVKRTGATWGTPASVGFALNNAQIAVDAAATPYVVGYAGGGRPLYLGRPEGGAWVSHVVANGGNVPSIAIDAAGHPHISYYDTYDYSIHYASY